MNKNAQLRTVVTGLIAFAAAEEEMLLLSAPGQRAASGPPGRVRRVRG
jgi:hypothetical protein